MRREEQDVLLSLISRPSIFDPAVVEQLLKTCTSKVDRESSEAEDHVEGTQLSESSEESVICEPDLSFSSSVDQNLSMPIFE